MTPTPQDGEDALVRVAALLRHRRLRATRAVRHIVPAVARSGRPVTVQQLVDATGLPTSSVYRNVAALADAEVLAVVRGADRIDRFELAELVAGQHHHHLVCTACGLVDDYATPPDLEEHVDAVSEVIAAERGWILRRHTLDFVGLCGECSRVRPAPAAG